MKDKPIYRKGDFAFDPWQAPEHRKLGDYMPRKGKQHGWEIELDPRPLVMREAAELRKKQAEAKMVNPAWVEAERKSHADMTQSGSFRSKPGNPAP